MSLKVISVSWHESPVTRLDYVRAVQAGERPSVEHFLYRSVIDSRQHRNRVSAYLVHRFDGSVVLARIEPLGLVPRGLASQELALQGLRRNLLVTGPWQPTPSHRHTRVRLSPTSETTKVAPRTP